MLETTNSILRVREGLSMLGIRLGVHHLTWEGVDVGGEGFGSTLGLR